MNNKTIFFDTNKIKRKEKPIEKSTAVEIKTKFWKLKSIDSFKATAAPLLVFPEANKFVKLKIKLVVLIAPKIMRKLAELIFLKILLEINAACAFPIPGKMETNKPERQPIKENFINFFLK